MNRTAAVVVSGVLLLALAACGGGGGGDEEAFCDDLEALSDQVADGDLASDGGLEDAVDTANSLFENASDDEQEAVEAVGNELEEADPDDAADTAEVIQDELGDIAEDTCDLDGDEFAVAEDTTTTEPDDETTTTEPDDTTTAPDDGGEGDEQVGPREPVPADLEADFAALADTCFQGDFASCDELFRTTPPGAVAEAYGDTCAGRIDDGRGFDFECATLVAEPFAPPPEVVDQTNGQACFAGDMAACDALLAAGPGTPDGTYGFFCGGRLNEQVVGDAALCVDIFGEQAIF